MGSIMRPGRCSISMSAPKTGKCCACLLNFDIGEDSTYNHLRAAEQVVGYKGEDLFNVFTTKMDGDSASEKYKLAEKTAWRMLTNSTMQKITHGKELTHTIHCGALMDLPENEGRDAEPGTFGELIRYGSVHLEQTRARIAYVDPVPVAPELIIHKKLLEA
jgi:hypothetical protein